MKIFHVSALRIFLFQLFNVSQSCFLFFTHTLAFQRILSFLHESWCMLSNCSISIRTSYTFEVAWKLDNMKTHNRKSIYYFLFAISTLLYFVAEKVFFFLIFFFPLKCQNMNWKVNFWNPKRMHEPKYTKKKYSFVIFVYWSRWVRIKSWT